MTNETAVNTGNGNGNGHLPTGGRHESINDSIFLDEGPELMVESPAVDTDDERRPELVRSEGDIAAEVQTELGKRTSRGRRLAMGAGFILAVVFVAGFAAYFMFGGGATRKAKVGVNANRGNVQESDEVLTRQAVDQLKSNGGGITLTDGTVITPKPSPVDPQQQVTQGPSEPVTQLPSSLSATVSPTPAAMVAGDTQQQQAQQSSTISKVVSSGRNGERSLWLGDDTSAGAEKQPKKPERIAQESNMPGVALPSFGSMLPVRSLGAIYTLRSGGLARFELTTDVKGKGWSLPHGTVMVGALRGSEYDRAYISLIGFIDSESGKFVKITGDVLGSDGGAGVRGKRRKLSSSWSKVLARMGEAGLSIAGGLASSVGRRPVIVSDAFGSVGYRVTNEFDGVLQNKDKNVFVEVPAGTTCYMMITQLPDSVQGVDALAKFPGREVEDRADSDVPRSSTGISEHELAELMQSGDRERIRAALPRMTPEMKRVAEAVLAQGEDR
jgi:hypothetical protein